MTNTHKSWFGSYNYIKSPNNVFRVRMEMIFRPEFVNVKHSFTSFFSFFYKSFKEFSFTNAIQTIYYYKSTLHVYAACLIPYKTFNSIFTDLATSSRERLPL